MKLIYYNWLLIILLMIFYFSCSNNKKSKNSINNNNIKHNNINKYQSDTDTLNSTDKLDNINELNNINTNKYKNQDLDYIFSFTGYDELFWYKNEVSKAVNYFVESIYKNQKVQEISTDYYDDDNIDGDEYATPEGMSRTKWLYYPILDDSAIDSEYIQISSKSIMLKLRNSLLNKGFISFVDYLSLRKIMFDNDINSINMFNLESLKTISNKLKIVYVLYGKILYLNQSKSEDNCKIILQLFNIINNEIIWSATYPIIHHIKR